MNRKINWKTVKLWVALLIGTYVLYLLLFYFKRSPFYREKKEKAPIEKITPPSLTAFDSAKYYKGRYVAEKKLRHKREDSLQAIIDSLRKSVVAVASKKDSVKIPALPEQKKKVSHQRYRHSRSNGRGVYDAHHNPNGDCCCCLH